MPPTRIQKNDNSRARYIAPKHEAPAAPRPVTPPASKGTPPAPKAVGYNPTSSFSPASSQPAKKSWVDRAANNVNGFLKSSYEDAKALQQQKGVLKLIGDFSVGVRDGVSAVGDAVRTAEQFYASSDNAVVKHVGGTLTALGKGTLSPALVTDHKQSTEELKENALNAAIELGTAGLGKAASALFKTPVGKVLQGTAGKLGAAVLDSPVAKGVTQALESPVGRELLEKGGKLVDDVGSRLHRLNHAPDELLQRAGGQKGLDVKPAAIRKQPFADGPTGPEPVITTPAPEAVMQARVRLQNLAPGEKLSSEDVRLLLEDTVDATRKGLLNSGEEMGVARDQLFQPEHIAGFCEMAEGMAWHHLKKLGVPESSLRSNQAQELFGQYRHAFLVTEMPDGKRYLLDPTARQFYPSDASSKLAGPGQFMRGTPESASIAHELLEKGYVELTEDAARFYAQSFGGPAEATGQQMLDLLSSSTRKMNYSPILFSGMMPEVPSLVK